MRNRAIFGILLLILLLSGFKLHAQLHNYGVKFGAQFGYLYPSTEFYESDGLKFSFLTKGYLRVEVSNLVGLEFGSGYGSLSGLDFNRDYYRTSLVPIDFKALISPFSNENVNLYFIAGIGLLNYKVTNFPSTPTAYPVDSSGWTGNLIGGIGLEIKLSRNVTFDISAGANFSFTDNLDYYRDGAMKDGFYNLSMGLNFWLGSDANADDDRDGLTNIEESELGTDPDYPDSDKDGITDGDEMKKYRTSPFDKDSDQDDLSDYSEINTYKTLPNKSDSDGDGMTDGIEINTYKTDPNLFDTDGDGLNDGDEIYIHKTDPLKADSDNDGLTDGLEINTHSTNPLNSDSDDGSVDDQTEVLRGTNPNDPEDDMLRIGESIVLEGLTFSTGSTEITEVSYPILENLYTVLQSTPDIVIEIRGYTDNIGDEQYNYSLSQKRADLVREWLIIKGISFERITAKGFGPENPIVSNATLEGRTRNRRIEVVRIR
ncbi:MAG: OmpA family protein [bacterium]